MTTRYGIIGYPVSHSLSPAMHNAAFGHLGLDAEYRLFEVEPAQLEPFLLSMVRKGIAGVNVTIPHKIAASEYLRAHGDLGEAVVQSGAVNTIKAEGGRLKGYNTDGAGFYRSLVSDLGFDPEGKTVFVLGAGGAATAVVMYLGVRPRKIYVTDIDKDQAERLRARYGQYFDRSRIAVCRAPATAQALAGSDLLVNATPAGMKEDDPPAVDPGVLHKGLSVYDLVYNRPATALVKEASARGLRAVTGIGMLLYQGVAAFEIWTGREAPVEVMRKALVEGLRGRG